MSCRRLWKHINLRNEKINREKVVEMKSLLIVGAGQFGQLVKELAEIIGYEKIGFLDDYSECAIGKIDDYRKFKDEYQEFIVAIGNPSVRRKIVEEFESCFKLANVIHPEAVISKSAQIGTGCVIEANAVINTEAVVGKACLINAGIVVNHNSKINDYCQIDCNAVVAASAVVPENTKVISCTVWCEK